MLISDLIAGADSDVALVRSSGEELSYSALRAAAERGAARLGALGLGPGLGVGVAAEDPAELLIGALSVWRSGAAVVPLDARAGGRWVEEAVRRARVAAVVRGAGLEGSLVVEPREEPVSLDARAGIVLFTSGSSGPPKGAVLSREGVIANVEAILRYLPVRAFPRTALVLPMAYSYALVGQALTTLRAGGTLLLLGDLVYPAKQLEAMVRLRADGLSSVPTSLRLLCRVATEMGLEGGLPLGYVASAGGPLDRATVDQLRSVFPRARLFNQYGLTEASPRVTAVSDAEEPFLRGSVGRPLSGVEVRAVGTDGQPLPLGGEGELAVRGPSVMLGYLDEPEATARVLSDSGWLRTGDAGRVDADGYVYVTGRLDGVVKCGGERVSLEEVASALRGAAGGSEVQVVAVADELLGARLVAIAEGGEELVPLLRRAARERLPPAKRPARVVAVSALPRTANGKVDLKALAQLARDGE